MRPLVYQWREISLSEGNRLRALAILMIVIHNFLHLVISSPGENEFSYSAEKFQSFQDSLWNTPYDCVRIIFSYLGHYGVQVFFFLSGYGVALKYRDASPRWWPFVKKRLSTLYPAVFVAACGYILYDGIRLGWNEVFATEGLNLVRQMTGVSNFIPDNIYHPIGPWWFIGIIVQFYLVAPLLLKQRKQKQTLFLLVIVGAILLEYFIGPLLLQKFSLNINLTILGHLDICALGMLLAQHKKLSIPLWVFALAFGLFVCANYGATMWIIAALSVTILLVPSLRLLIKLVRKNERIDKAIVYLGGLSMYLFLCNGYLRPPLLEWAKSDPVWWKSLGISILFLGLVVVWAIFIRKLEKTLRLIWKR